MYSVDEVAGILGLHVRTVRGYVRDGRLKAVRIGKQYRITEADLQTFTGGALHEPHTVLAPAEVSVTAIVHIAGAGRRLMDRVSTHAVAAAATASNDRPRLDIHTIYDESRDDLRVVIFGDADEAAAMVSLINTLAKEVG